LSARDMSEARDSVRAEVERLARAEPTLDPDEYADRVIGAWRVGSTIVSGQDRLGLTAKLLPTISDEEVNAAFRDLTEPAHAAALLVLRPDARQPNSATLLATIEESLARTPQPIAEPERPESFLDNEPSPGDVAEMSIEPRTGTLSAWLSNGVRVHHRTLDDRTGEARIVITLAGGRIEETAATRGLSEAACTAWNVPASRSRSAADLDSLRVGKDIRINAWADEDAIRITCAGDSARMGEALRLVHLLLREPVIEPVHLARWKWRQRSMASYRTADPVSRLLELLDTRLYAPEDARHRPLGGDESDSIDLPRAQSWLEHLVAAPIEVAIVGDIRRQTALELAATYLGSLPDRGRIGPQLFAPQRGAPRRTSGEGITNDHGLCAPRAGCLVAVRAPLVEDSDDAMLAEITADILRSRVSRNIREDRPLASWLMVKSLPSSAYREAGVIAAAAVTEPGSACETLGTIGTTVDEFVKAGPEPEEFRQALAMLAQRCSDRVQRSDLWAEYAAESEYRGKRLGDASTAESRAAALTADRMMRLVRSLDQPGQRIGIITGPPAPESAAER
ncbi:MAG TPA: insulinase family protein, partial [Phycisphaerales bacterium]|nr:insulinase family protein [Phycisphaerales bacterium]